MNRDAASTSLRPGLLGSPGALAWVTVGFATAVAMWAVGYVCRLPGVQLPGSVVIGPMLACMLIGGIVIGGHAGGRVLDGALAGLIASAVNLLILGSFLAGEDTNELRPSALIWVPGSFVAGALLGAIGAAFGRATRSTPLPASSWRSGFALVTAAATLLAVIAGGVVTSAEAGLAVPDWPNSFGSNMFLYPLSKMTGGRYYEHAHRLYGFLVGLTTVVLVIVIFATDRRAWLRGVAIAALVAVVAQGILGGRRVVDDSTSLAIVHGVLAQLFFATVGVIWASTTRAWIDSPGRSVAAPVAALLLIATLVLQIALGALWRHLATDEKPFGPGVGHSHLTLAAAVIALACVAGLRGWARASQEPAGRMLRRFSIGLVHVMGLQLILGFVALIAVLPKGGPTSFEIIAATAHQANGALLLVIAAQVALWTWRGGAEKRGQTPFPAH